MFRKVLALLVAAVITSATVYAQYQEIPFVPGQPPPEAKPGEAWCIYVYPAKYETYTEKVMVRDELIKMRPVPAEYGQKTEEFECAPAYEVGTPRPVQFAEQAIDIECVPAHEALRVVPAQFREVQKEVEVCPAYVERYWVPTKFRSSTRTFVICPERKELRKVQCVDGTNIDCFTVVGAPQQTQTVEVKTLVKDGYVAERLIPEQKQIISVKEVAREAYVEERVQPAQMSSYKSAVVARESAVDIRQMPNQVGQVTRMTIVREASVIQEEVPEVKKIERRKVLKTPERPVWRKQLLNQMSQAPLQPPMEAVAAESILEDYSSIPGAGAFRPTTRAQYK